MVSIDASIPSPNAEIVDASGAGPDEGAATTIHRPSLRRNIAHLMSSQIVTWILATVVATIVPRSLGPTSLGQLRVSTAVWTMAQLFIALGTSTFLMLEIARDRQRGVRLVGPIIVLRLVAYAVVAGVLAAVGVAVGADRDTVVVFAIVGLGVLLATVGEVWTAGLNGLEQMKYPAQTAIVSRILYAALVVAIVSLDGDVRAIAAAGLPSGVLAFVMLRAAFNRFGRTSFHRPLGQAPMLIRESKAFLALSAVIIVYQQIDTVVISTMVDHEVVGWYGTADTLFGTLLFIPTTLLHALLPRFSRLRDEPAELAQLVRQVFSSSMLIAVPIGLGTVVVANRFAVTLYGDKFRESGPVLQVFGVVIVLTFGTILLGGLAAATGHQRTWNLVMITAIVATVPLDLLLIPWADARYGNGAIGGALAYIVTETGMLVFGISRFARSIVNRESLVRLSKILAAGGLMMAATWPLRDAVFLVPAVVGAVVYVTAVLLLGALTDEEQAIVRRMTSRFGVRFAR